MYIDVSYKDNIPIIKISGELDMYDSTKMEQVFNSLPSDTDVLIDCEEISFVDSTIIGLFVRFSLTKSKDNRKVGLINVKSFFIQLLELAKLKKLFDIYSSAEEYFEDKE
jgi:anti-sigma B factor antagonist